MVGLETAKSGQLFVRDNELWEVIGFCDRPSVELQRVGTRFEDVNRVSLIAESQWAQDWAAVDDGDAIELLRQHIRDMSR